jgi:hypothetical protein
MAITRDFSFSDAKCDTKGRASKPLADSVEREVIRAGPFSGVQP